MVAQEKQTTNPGQYHSVAATSVGERAARKQLDRRRPDARWPLDAAPFR